MDRKTDFQRILFSKIQTSQLTGLTPGSDAKLVRLLYDNLKSAGNLLQETASSVLPVKHVTDHPVSEATPVWILFGTHTGNSEQLANDLAKKIAAMGLDSEVCDMGDFNVQTLKRIDKLLIIVSTDGEGDPPLMAEELLQYLHSGEVPELSHIAYSVLALGDSCYDRFCQAGKDFDSALEKSGARRISDRVDCDVDFEEDYMRWLEEVLPNLS